MSERGRQRPGVVSAGTSGDDADAQMTAERREVKYLLPPGGARPLADALTGHLPRHRYRGIDANPLPGAQSFVTTVYFDTADRALFRAAGGHDPHVKLRAKEYYDLHPGLVETATDPRQLMHQRPVLWLEVKHRDGDQSGKQRVGIAKRDVPAFLAGGRLGVAPELDAAHGDQGLAAVAALCARFPAPMRADSLVNYRRLAWQADDGSLRVTLDVDVAFFAPPPTLWTHDRVLLREELGFAVARETSAVVEVKAQGTPPAWLTDVLASAQPAPAYSKFVAASYAVHGPVDG